MRVLVNKFRPQDLLDVKEQIVMRRFLLTSIITCKKNLHNHFYKKYLWIKKYSQKIFCEYFYFKFYLKNIFK